MQGVQVRSLVGEPRSHMPHGQKIIIYKRVRDFLSSPVVKIPHFQCRDAEDWGSTPGCGTKILHAEQRSQKINFKNIYY